MAETHKAQMAGLAKELAGAGRRRRQEVAYKLALAAKANPDLVMPHLDTLLEALGRPEAQTRWEVLDALSELVAKDPDAVSAAFDGAEESLFDESSANVRLSAFVFLCRLAATSPERSDQAWPLLDEAIQCFHGDAEYRDMLAALLEMVKGDVSQHTKEALAARVKFDAKSGTGYIKSYSAEIVAAV